MKKSKRLKMAVTLGPTFIVRSCCKACGSGPSYYYYMMEKSLDIDARNYLKKSSDFMDWDLQCIKSPISKYAQIRFHTKISRNSFNMNTNSFKVKLHSTIGAKQHPMVDTVYCACWQTFWQFNQAGMLSRPHVVNRLGRYKYSQVLTE